MAAARDGTGRHLFPRSPIAGENDPAAMPTLAPESRYIVGLMTVHTTSRAADSFLSSNSGAAYRQAGDSPSGVGIGFCRA